MMMHLVGFIASVITEPRRLMFFRELLESIKTQKKPLDGLFISIHIDPSLNVDVKTLFKGIKNVRVLLQKRPKKQFAQIGEMLEKLNSTFPCPSEKVQFILFSDDDDLWHHERTEFYHEMWKKGHETSPEMMPIIASISVKERIVFRKEPCVIHLNTSHVDNMLECGCAILKRPSFPNIKEEEVLTFDTEYHEDAVRPHVLRDFFKDFGWICRNNRFADIEFRTFVRKYKGSKGSTLNVIPSHWMYFYRRCDKTYPAVTNPLEMDLEAKFVKLSLKEAIKLLTYAIEMTECHSFDKVSKDHYDRVCLYLTNCEIDVLNLSKKIKDDRNKLE
jgi:hypothetical protein